MTSTRNRIRRTHRTEAGRLLILTPIAVGLLFAFADGARLAAADPPVKLSAPASRVAGGVTRFGFNALAKLINEKPHDNILISPVSLADCLALAYNGAQGRTRTEIGSVLGASGTTTADFNSGIAALNSSLTGADPHTEIAIANALWVKQGSAFAPAYVERCRRFLKASARTLDFGKPSASQTINKWVDANTKGKITRIVSPADVARARAVLTNAVYFHGRWATPFPRARTRDQDFTLDSGGTKPVPMMSISEHFSYLDNETLQAVALPYGNGRLRMVVVLPHAGVSLSSVVGGLSSGQNWSNLLSQMHSVQLELSMPRFKMRYSDTAMTHTLATLGMPTAMTRRADFSGMGIKGVYLDKVVHEARMEVDEEGTVAAAATGMMMRASAMMRPLVMTVDHPFFCAICDDASGTVLFAGVVRNPG